MFFVHGFGCDQNMWRLLGPAYSRRYRAVLLDLVGSGGSDLCAYDPARIRFTERSRRDVVEMVDEFGQGPVLLVGHSVSAMIGMLANLEAPGRFAAQIMIGPSPCYINDGDYVGGFTRKDIDSLLETLESNYLGWSSTMAPAIMGAPEQPELRDELTNSFCRTDPDIAKQFARVTFLSDNRAELPRLTTPTLIVQCNDDLIAPVAVGEYMNRRIAAEHPQRHRQCRPLPAPELPQRLLPGHRCLPVEGATLTVSAEVLAGCWTRQRAAWFRPPPMAPSSVRIECSAPGWGIRPRR